MFPFAQLVHRKTLAAREVHQRCNPGRGDQISDQRLEVQLE